MKLICRLLVVSLLFLSFQTSAGMIGTDQAAADRVAALTDDEVRTLSGKLDALPAGGTSGWAIAAIVLIVAFIVWWLWYRK